MLLILAVSLVLYLATFENTTLVMFPAILLISGVSMELFLERKKAGKDIEVIEEDTFELGNLKTVGYYTVIAIFGIFLVGYAVTLAPLSIAAQLTGADAILYSVLIGISEEQFFRGFITDWLLSTFSQPYLALLAGAGIFGVYHFAVYNTSASALLYVTVGGFILGWVAYKSRRISPTMLAHSLNNLLAFVR